MSSHPLYEESYRKALCQVLSSHAPRNSSRDYLFSLKPSASREALGNVQLAAAAHPTTLQAAYDRARRARATISISYEQFAAHARALGHCEAPAYAMDLYLAAACRFGVCSAFQVLEQEFIERSRSVVTHLLRDAWVVDDVMQEVRRRLLVGPAWRIVSYKGTGPLGTWIRAIALNVARDHLRAEGARRRREEAQHYTAFAGAVELRIQAESLASCIARQGGRAACLDAVRSAFRSLPQCDRQLLHDYYLRGFSIDVLAPLCNVNRATVARRIRRATGAVRRGLRKRLAALHPREDSRALDSIALAACREWLAEAGAILVPSEQSEQLQPDLPG